LRQWYDDKISLVEGKLTEGIGWDPTLPTDKENVFGGITVDYQQDHESDVIEFGGPIVHKLADNTYAGFVFREQSLQQKEKTEEDSLFDLAAAIRKFEEGIKKVNNYLGQDRVGNERNEMPDLLPTEFSNAWHYRDEDGRLREHIITKLKGLIGIDHTKTLQNIQGKAGVFSAFDQLNTPRSRYISYTGGIYALLENDQAQRLRDLVKAKTKQSKTSEKAPKLQKYYNEAKREIIKNLNEDKDTEKTRLFIMFGAERLAQFIKDGGLGFTPNLLVLPVSAKSRSKDGSVRKLISILANELSGDLPGVDIVDGLIKNNKNVEYLNGDGETFPLTDSQGNAFTNLDAKTHIGPYSMTLQKAADRIAKGTFKITSVFPDYRSFNNFMRISDDMARFVDSYKEAEMPLQVLALDDCIYTGVTQKASAAALKEYAESNDVTMEIATYALVKT